MAKNPYTPNEFLKALRRRVAGPRGMRRFAAFCAIPYTTYRNYELGRNRVPLEAARAIAAATGEDVLAIMGGKEGAGLPGAPPAPRTFELQARGRVNLEAFHEKKDLKDRIPVQVTAEEYGRGDDFIKGGNRFALIARGACMKPTIVENDLLIFDTAAKPKDGDVVAAVVGTTWKVRRYHRDARRKIVFLQADNGRYSPDLLREGKPEARKFRVAGVLVSLRRGRKP